MSAGDVRTFLVEAAYLDALAADGFAPLPREVYRHALRVLRLDEGATLELRDGAGRALEARLERRDGLWGAAALGSVRTLDTATAREVHLVVALFKAQRFAWLLEKAAELGATSLIAFPAERSVVRLTGDDGLLERSERILREATRQCGGATVPTFRVASGLQTALEGLGPNTRITFGSPGATVRFDPAGSHPLALVTGPEGGLAPGEERALLERGAQAVSLGPRILRAETAPIAMLAAARLTG